MTDFKSSKIVLKPLKKPRKRVLSVTFLPEILSLPSFVYVTDAIQNYTNFNLLQFLVGMCTIWDSIALLFLLFSQRCIRKTSPSSRLCSWGFK